MRNSKAGHVLAACGLAGALMWVTAGTVGAQVEQGQPAEELAGEQDRDFSGFARDAGPSGSSASKPDFKPFKDVSEGYKEVVSTADGKKGLYTLWVRDKDQQMLAELPRGYEKQRHFIAGTVAAGDIWAGLQGPERYVYWKRFDDRMALIEPNVGTRSTGDQESKSAVGITFTDRVLLDVPIVAIGPNRQPVIDLDDLLLSKGSEFFGRDLRGVNKNLMKVVKAKSFPQNMEITIEAPVADGQLKRFHYSVSVIPDRTGYKPREADERVGYFTTVYRDLGKYQPDEKWVRYINRWDLEKADKKLRLSPPKQPIVYHIEHTVPVRYRRFVREGIEYWNDAFEQIGIVGAIEVRQQDESSGAYMDLDPEDVRYNFIRWISNDISTAIGPSRAHPLTGEILDADVILTDGWIRAFWRQYNELLPEQLMEGMTPETIAWLDEHPNWDPRVRLAPPEDRDRMLVERARQRMSGERPALAMMSPVLAEDEDYATMSARLGGMDNLCMAARGKAFDMAQARMTMEMLSMFDEDDDDEGDEEAEGEEPKDDKPKSDKLDGIPDWFVGPLLADLVAHEVGHTLGLRHNFKASAIYSLEEINSDEVAGKKPFTGSVMDYNPVNINMSDGPVQGDFAMIGVGPYDMWAIEFGYGDDPKGALKRVAQDELVYLTDEDTIGPDPLARRYDFSAEPLEYAQSQMRLASELREKIMENFVKDGESWSKARRGYQITLGQQARSISMMANWLGGAYVSRARKGDPDAGAPTRVVEAEKQRAALEYIINQAFYDDAFGLSPELLAHMTVDKWSDQGGRSDYYADPTWPVHDQIMGVQSSALTLVLNPTTLRRIYDNEFRVPADEDALTLAEVMESVTESIWSELDGTKSGKYTARQPKISSLRRNLQREHMERLIDLSMPGEYGSTASKAVGNLALLHLRQLRERIKSATNGSGPSKLDPYSLAHLTEAEIRITKALDAQYIYNTDAIGGGSMGGFFFMKEGGE